VNGGFIQLRRGLFEHLRDGRLTLLELSALCVILLLADKATGIWIGSARALAANCGAGDITDRQARHLLESLEKKGYIRRFPRRRSHANYPILVNRYLVTFGAYSGMTLNAAATDDWRQPVYESRQEQGAERGAEDGVHQGAGRAPYQEVEVKREERKNKPTSAPETVAPIDLPPWLPLGTWNDFLEMRKVMRKPLMRKAVDLMLRKLAAWRVEGQDVGEILERSVMNGWVGIFPLPKENSNGRTAGPKSFDAIRRENTDAALKRVIERHRERAGDSRPALQPGPRRASDGDIRTGTPQLESGADSRRVLPGA
jgi:hypothetical protein